MSCEKEDCIQCLIDNEYEFEHFGKTEIRELKKGTRLLIKHFPFTIPDLEVTVGFDENNDLKVYADDKEGYLCDILDDSITPTVINIIVLN